MRLSKGISKQGRKKSNKARKANQCKVKIVHKPSPSNHVRLLKALSILLSKEDIFILPKHSYPIVVPFPNIIRGRKVRWLGYGSVEIIRRRWF